LPSGSLLAVMKRFVLTTVLVAINCALALALGRLPQAAPPAEVRPEPPRPKPSPFVKSAVKARTAPAPKTPYAAIYSSAPKQFVTNLRAIGCPEETIKDILIAEINRGYAAQENALRPTPADHVPWGWSPKTSEGKIIARRQEAAAIAREKAATLREALGYEVAVAMPTYAMTTSDLDFERVLNSLPVEKRRAAQQIQDSYWSEVQYLRNRTRGFWLADDVSALNELQARRKTSLENLLGQ
jgi:hypothetical protein